MTHIIRTVASSAVAVLNRSSNGTLRSALPVHVRTVFSKSGIGLENFQLAREQHVSRHAPSIDGFKKRFLESINKSDSPVFTEDLRNMIMAAENDEEVNAVVQALKKYNSNKLKLTDYHFGSPIMRLLYIRNKTDLAMELYKDETLKDIFSDSGSALILLNKLIEDKRYDDAIKIFEYGSERGFTTASGRTYPTDVVMLTVEALYRQNTKQSLEKAKELISKVAQRDSEINPRTAAMLALLAIQQGESSFAMEIIGAVRGQNLTTIQNIRAICYAEMGRAEEAINVVHLLADQPPVDDDRRRVFPLVLQYIQKAVEKSNDQDLQSRFGDLSKFVSQNNRVSATDLTNFLDEPVTRRGAMTNNRPGVQQGLRDGFQRTGGNARDSGFRAGYNQSANNSRQRTSNSGYNRDNQYQSGRFRNDNPQNSFNETDRSFNRNQRSYGNEYSRQENPIQQANQSSPSFNRRDSNSSVRPRDRESEQNVSRRSGTKLGPMEATLTSPIPQRTKQSSRSNEDSPQLGRRSQKFEQNEEKSSNPGKRDERLSGGNTGIQQQSPWTSNDRKSS